MATSTVKTQIVVQFEDQFTEAANKANSKYLNILEDAQKESDKFNQQTKEMTQDILQELRNNINDLTGLTLAGGIGSIAVTLATLVVSTSGLLLSLFSIGVALTGVFGIWLAGENLNE